MLHRRETCYPHVDSHELCSPVLRVRYSPQLRRKVRAGDVGDDTLETLIAILAERFPSVVGEEERGAGWPYT